MAWVIIFSFNFHLLRLLVLTNYTNYFTLSNGTTWQTLPTLPAYSVFYTMNLLSANDIWASGEVDQANKSAIAIEHWDGHRWTQFSLPTAYGSMAMTALTDQNIWGVGDPVGNPQADQLLHWDGKAWHRTSIPVIGSGASIAVSGQQLWIVSGDPISTNQDGSALILGQRTCA